MLGADFDAIGWPVCGEVRILEMVGGSHPEWRDNTVHGTIHWENGNGDWWMTGNHKQLDSERFHDGYRTVDIIWDTEYIYHFIDECSTTRFPLPKRTNRNSTSHSS
jgi:hypothetical protein